MDARGRGRDADCLGAAIRRCHGAVRERRVREQSDRRGRGRGAKSVWRGHDGPARLSEGSLRSRQHLSPQPEYPALVILTPRENRFDHMPPDYPPRERKITMGRIIVTEYVSLDRVMEDPGGAEGFKHGGWSREINRGPEGDKFKLDETLDAEVLLLGRVTYEGFAAAWPSRKDEFADKFNRMPKYVVSSTIDDARWDNSTVLKGDVVEEVSKLRQRLDGNIVVHGSAQLARLLLAHDLIDELRLMVFPVVLGSGKRLFGEASDKNRLRLADSRTVGDGISILIYEPMGAPAKG